MDTKQRTFDATAAKALANLAAVAARDVERAAADRPWSAASPMVPPWSTSWLQTSSSCSDLSQGPPAPHALVR